MYPLKDIVRFWHDTLYGVSKYSPALYHPKIYVGTFPETEQGQLQKQFYEFLLEQGYNKTVWQLVFPGQIAGCVKKETGK